MVLGKYRIKRQKSQVARNLLFAYQRLHIWLVIRSQLWHIRRLGVPFGGDTTSVSKRVAKLYGSRHQRDPDLSTPTSSFL